MTMISQQDVASPFARPMAAFRAWIERGRAIGLHPVVLRRRNVLWLLILLIAVATIPLLGLTNYRFMDGPGPTLVSFLFVVWAGSTLFITRCSDPMLGHALSSYAQINALSLLGLLYSYLGAAAAMPLQDGLFLQMDRAIGFDWMAHMRWLTADALRVDVAVFAYSSLMYQVLLIAPIMVAFQRFHQIQILTLAWLIAITVTIMISTIVPAVSVFQHFGIEAMMARLLPTSGAVHHLPELMAARSGADLLLFHNAQGIVTFPSFHACSGALMLWAFWQVKVLRIPGVVLNGLMIAATPVVGSHYLVDVIAGVALAFGSIALSRRLMPDPV